MKKVSIIVPVYRTQQWLERCVLSILEQTYQNIELVLVDDGSPDECPALCDAWAQKDERVRVLHKKNGGLMAAWMDGVKISTGDYLCFVDSDDWIDTCMVENMLQNASDCGKEVICGNYVQEEETRSFPVIQPLAPGIYEGSALKEQVFGRLLGEERRPITLSRCMKLFSRALIEENMHYCDPTIVMGEDVNITLPALLSAERIVVLPQACYYHYLFLQSSMAHRYNAKLYDNILRLNELIGKILIEKSAPDAEGQAEREFVLLFFLVMKNEVRSRQKGWRKRLQSMLWSEKVRAARRGRQPKLAAKENRILMAVLKHPNRLFMWGLRLLFAVYDFKRG
ncbi:MAG: glycosyltransferase family 2 protein [Lachnospiraceae bacterium]|nr:glycosyltransferase family 2 protein [Lachnospiraceae bacterium]